MADALEHTGRAEPPGRPDDLHRRDRGPAEVVAELLQRGETVATAESLTAGLVAATLAEVPGVSGTLRGGLVVYQNDLKRDLAGVDAAALADGGPVQARVACQLALGATRRCGATWGLATTGVAGPGPADGHPAGTVFIAVARADQPESAVAVRRLALAGDRAAVRAATVAAVLELLALALAEPAPEGRYPG